MVHHISRSVITTSIVAVSMLFAACSGGAGNQNTNTAVSSGPPRYEGYLDIASCDGIHGWVWDENAPDSPLSVEIYDGDKLLATMKADELRDNLIAAGKGNGKHAYTYVTPPYLKDGKPHSIRVTIAGAGFELSNSPKTINCTFQTQK